MRLDTPPDPGPEPAASHGHRWLVAESRCQLLRQLGVGGMGRLELAVQRSPLDFARPVVVKRLLPELVNQPRYARMFQNEASLAASLSHPNVVQCHSADVDAEGPFLVMEYLHGQSYANARGLLGDACASLPYHMLVLIEILKALEYLHESTGLYGQRRPIVHRDVSPDNVILTYGGQVKLIDFGIACTAGSNHEIFEGGIQGKVAYMAPEQAQQRPIDSRTDLYAVAIMLWEVVHQRRRWQDHTEDEILHELRYGTAQVECDAASHGLPRWLDEVCARATSPDPNGRFQSASDFRQVLEQILESSTQRPTCIDLGTAVRRAFDDEARESERFLQDALALPAAPWKSDPHARRFANGPSDVTAVRTSWVHLHRDLLNETAPEAPVSESQIPEASSPTDSHVPPRKKARRIEGSNILLLIALLCCAGVVAVYLLGADLRHNVAGFLADVQVPAQAHEPQTPPAPNVAISATEELARNQRSESSASPENVDAATPSEPARVGPRAPATQTKAGAKARAPKPIRATSEARRAPKPTRATSETRMRAVRPSQRPTTKSAPSRPAPAPSKSEGLSLDQEYPW